MFSKLNGHWQLSTVELFVLSDIQISDVGEGKMPSIVRNHTPSF